MRATHPAIHWSSAIRGRRRGGPDPQVRRVERALIAKAVVPHDAEREAAHRFDIGAATLIRKDRPD